MPSLPMSSAPASKWVICLWLLAVVLPRASTSKGPTIATGDDERILANTALNHAGCSVDVSGQYISEYGVQLNMTQTNCSLFLDPPGKVVGLVIGKSIHIAGQDGGPADGGKIFFSNGAAWTKTPAVQGSWPVPASLASGRPTALSTRAPVVSTTPFPWWAVETGVAIAGAGAIAGGLAAGLTHTQAAKTPEHNAGHSTGAEQHGYLKKVQDSRFMSPTAQPAAIAPPLVLLGGLAILSCCCVLMLGGIALSIHGWRSAKETRSLRVFSRVPEEDDEVSEDEVASEEGKEDEESIQTSLLDSVAVFEQIFPPSPVHAV